MSLKDLIIDEKSYKQGFDEGYTKGAEEMSISYEENIEDLKIEIFTQLIKEKRITPVLIAHALGKTSVWVEKWLKEEHQK